MINVRLNDVRIVECTRRGKCCFDSIAKINTDHILRAPARGELCVASFAAAAFKHDLVAKELRRHRGDPPQKLLSVTCVFLGEVLPLPAKASRRRCFVTIDHFRVGETRYSPDYWKRLYARAAAQLAFHDLLVPRRG